MTTAPTPLLGAYPVGSVVELKGGGPRMTVLGWEAAMWPSEAGARCAWFIQGALREGTFPLAALRRVARQAGRAGAGGTAVAKGIAAAASPKPLAGL